MAKYFYYMVLNDPDIYQKIRHSMETKFRKPGNFVALAN